MVGLVRARSTAMTINNAVRVPIRTKRYFLCPSCMKHEFQIEHLFDGQNELKVREIGPWQCDECDATWSVQVNLIDETIDVIQAPQKSWHNWDILEFVGRGNAVVRLVVPGLTFDRHHRLDDELERKRHYYEEHTCPINYLRSAVMVVLGDAARFGDDDPHGLFRFVTTFEHPLRPHQLLSSNETNVLADIAHKALATLGRS